MILSEALNKVSVRVLKKSSKMPRVQVFVDFKIVFDEMMNKSDVKDAVAAFEKRSDEIENAYSPKSAAERIDYERSTGKKSR
ncbi:hypothetical protein HN803_03830 [candidate division WWE3 bacterium]|jgi:hypothetical protein|nr:hypothetical protein [candidate division WWE3 bacterium]